ncbi:hypothetical protein Tco_1325597 [Tanacetum coccineum]
MDCGGGGLCFLRGLGSLDRIESGDPSGVQTHHIHVYAYETHIQVHQVQLQLQITLIQTRHQVYETRFQMQQAEMAELRVPDCRRQAQMAETLRSGLDARIPDHQDASGDADTKLYQWRRKLQFARDDRRNVQTARPCYYADFMKCQPLNFKRTEGVVGLTRWIEKMESVFNISGWKKMTDKYCPLGEIQKLEIEL